MAAGTAVCILEYRATGVYGTIGTISRLFSGRTRTSTTAHADRSSRQGCVSFPADGVGTIHTCTRHGRYRSTAAVYSILRAVHVYVYIIADAFCFAPAYTSHMYRQFDTIARWHKTESLSYVQRQLYIVQCGNKRSQKPREFASLKKRWPSTVCHARRFLPSPSHLLSHVRQD